MFFLKISLIIRKRRLRAAIPDLIVHFRRRDSREDSPVFLCPCAPWGAAKDRGEQCGRRGACAFFCMHHKAASRCQECPTLQTSLLSPVNKACLRAKQGFFRLQTSLLFAASFRAATFPRNLNGFQTEWLRPEYPIALLYVSVRTPSKCLGRLMPFPSKIRLSSADCSCILRMISV